MKVEINLLAVVLLPLLVESTNDPPLEEVDEQLQVQNLQAIILKLLKEIKTKESQFKDQIESQQLEINRLSLNTERINQLESKLSDCQELKSKGFKDQIESKQLVINKLLLYTDQIKHLQSNLSDCEEFKSKELKESKRLVNNNRLLYTDQIKQLQSNLSDCQETSKASDCLGKSNGIYTIHAKPIPVTCDSNSNGTGWTVILRRVDGRVNFNRNWADYKKGFGDIGGSFFIGLENLHILTASQPHELYVHLEDFEGQTRYAKYSDFKIGNEADLYKLKSIGHYSGTAGDALKYHVGIKFSTPDRDNDTADNNCAKEFKSGWWFYSCHDCNLNGPQIKGVGLDKPRISWNTWKHEGLKSSQMMIRPKIL